MKKIIQNSRFFLLAWVITIIGCKSDPTPTLSAPIKKEVNVPAFNRDSAYVHVQTQVGFGTREMGSPGHELCKTWIVSKLKAYGMTVQEQNFDAKLYTGDLHPGTNIIGKMNPSAARRILLATHWDTRHIAENDLELDKRDDPIIGADDGASGVAVLLELARTISLNGIDLGVDLVFFDAEDAGANGGGRDETWCLGAQYWARNLPSSSRPQYGILLDMVGSKGATFPKEGFSRQFAPGIVEKVWTLAQSMGYGHYFVNTSANPLTDDHRFVNQIAKVPMIDIINYPRGRFGDYWHTHNDNLSIIDKRTLGVVGQVVLATLYREDAGAI